MKQLFAIDRNSFGIPTTDLTDTTVQTVFQITFGVAGAIAVVVLVLAGLKYVLSRGEPAEVAKAKNAIVYAAIGLAVSLAAFSLVSFLVKEV